MQPASQVEPADQQDRQWQPLPRIQRRIVGVLIEKAKTTPDGYPLSLNALTSGCNQKSNRHPQMNLDPDDVEEALDSLRKKGAVGEVLGGGRVAKYRHYMKDWLGTDGTELAVMAELLLRGPQTAGELRGRAARMAPIADVSSLQPIIDSLIAKDLAIALTPPGRGQIVTHTLYEQQEQVRLREQYGAGGHPTSGGSTSSVAAAVEMQPPQRDRPSSPSSSAGGLDSNIAEDLRQQIAQLRQQLSTLRQDVDELRSQSR